MKNMKDKLDLAYLSTKEKAREFLMEERGDTNFISIAIILIVVIVIAIIFITLGDEIGAALSDKIDELKDALGI